MTNLAIRFKKSSKRSTGRAPALSAVSRCLHVGGSCSWNISPPLSVTVSSTMGVEHQVFLPRHCASVSHVSDGDGAAASGIDFDVAYFYGDSAHVDSTCTNPSRQNHMRSPTDRQGEPVLVPLLVAQWKNSIRRRAEGFEMKRQDPTSSAAVQCTLISLQDALARDDIRRRDEGFELALKLQPPPNPDAVHVASTRHDSDSSLLRPVEPQALESSLQLSSDAPPTSPSVYSSESWTETLRVISAARSLPSVSPTDVEELFKFASHNPGTKASNAEGNLSNSSIDEASFIRMAAPLGW